MCYLGWYGKDSTLIIGDTLWLQAELCLPQNTQLKNILTSEHQALQNIIVVGDRVFTEVTELKWGHWKEL